MVNVDREYSPFIYSWDMNNNNQMLYNQYGQQEVVELPNHHNNDSVTTDIGYLWLYFGAVLIGIGICLLLCIFVAMISYMLGYNKRQEIVHSNTKKYSRILMSDI